MELVFKKPHHEQAAKVIQALVGEEEPTEMPDA
jgi:hypothetical protein